MEFIDTNVDTETNIDWIDDGERARASTFNRPLVQISTILNSNFSEVDTLISGLNSSLSGVETNISSLSGTVVNLSGRVIYVETNVGSNSTLITSLTSRVNTAEGNISSLTTRVNTVEGEIDAVQTSITDINSTLIANTGDISTIENNVQSISQNLDSFNGGLVTTSTNVNAQIGQTIVLTADNISITLPSNPSINDRITFINGSVFKNITILRNTKTIMEFAEDLIINVEYASFSLVYDGATWRIL